MRKKVITILISVVAILMMWFSGHNLRDRGLLLLAFSDYANMTVINAEENDSIEVIEEEMIIEQLNSVIYTVHNQESIFCGIKINDTLYHIGQISTIQTPRELITIEKVEIFGSNAVKFHGVLGANYAIGYYYVYSGALSDSCLMIEGNLIESDLTGDGYNEIIATTGTVGETSIYIMNKQIIQVSNINKSVNAVSARLLDSDSKTFELYFEPDKPKHYIYEDKKLKVR